MCCHCHYPHVGVVQVLDDLHSVHLWHLNVHEHEGGLLVVEGGECVGDMMADDDLLWGNRQTAQHLLEKLQLQGVVIEQEDFGVFPFRSG